MPRVRLFGIEIDPLRVSAAVGRLLEWTTTRDGVCRYVVTPNADHAVMFQENDGLRRAYAEASLVLVDGMPVLWAAKMLRRGVPERVPGSDLVPALFAAASERFRSAAARGEASEPLSVFLLGAMPGVAQRAAARIETRWPGVSVVGCDSPAPGFEKRAADNDAILARIAASGCQVLVVGFGAPKQELWVHTHRDRIAAPVALCVGATIDFLAGEKQRAPVWMRRVGLEWVHRLASEPRRLARRYLRDAIRFPRLVLGELLRPDLELR
jgi:N-acetylglucosaminyldiphosphoundecaprenol N-acetyl-beta-D-mannosaminyltransferase